MLRVMKFFKASVAIVLLLGSGTLSAEDWPTYQHDNARSGQTNEELTLPLAEAWAYRAAQRPHQAWPEPAKWDGWNKVYGLKDRMVFDKAFQVAAAGRFIYFGSSVDDKVYCLDAATGEVRWSFFTEGPVRFAPVVVQNKLFVGSDDGYVYCLNAETGELLWKNRPGPEDRRVPGNGRLVSLWAIRSGVVVVDGTAYACAGVFPTETVYLCALDTGTGKELWKTSMNDFPAQGYMLASASRLYVTTGRSSPLVFDRANGKRLYQVQGGSEGGTYALLEGDSLTFGPGQTGQMATFNAGQKDHLASFEGNHMIVQGTTSFLHTDKELSSLNRGEYVRLYSERRQRLERKKELGKALKRLAAKESEKTISENEKKEVESFKAEVERIAVEIDDQTRRMRECLKWRVSCGQPLSLILAGKTLFAGGHAQVAAYATDDGHLIWESSVAGNVFGLAVANGKLFVSTDEGAIHCFAPPNAITASSAKPTTPVRALPVPGTPSAPPAVPGASPPDPKVVADSKPHGGELLDGVHGPFLEFIEPGTVRIDWETLEPASCSVEFDQKDVSQPKKYDEEGPPATRHSIIIRNVERDVLYYLRVLGRTEKGNSFATASYEFDSNFNYIPLQVANTPSPFRSDSKDDQYAALARKMIAESNTTRGYALVLGGNEGRLAYYLARNSDLQIVVLEQDRQQADLLRRLFDKAGLYGSRVSVHEGSVEKLPYGPYFANLITSESTLAGGELPASLSELYRVLRPAGGVIYLGAIRTGGADSKLTQSAIDTWTAKADLTGGKSRLETSDGLFWIHRRDKLAGSGEWTHQYALPDNSACSRDDIVRGDLSILWWGAPGPRPMPDRGPRNPAPVSANGRLYIQGNRTLFGLDAYNGTILWSKQIPTMRRANIPRDGSNMVASDNYLYVAMGPYCVGFDGQTGERRLNMPIPGFPESKSHTWSYLACVGDVLIGSACKKGSQYLGDDGEWYEDDKPGEIARVTSDVLFAVDRLSGKTRWEYRGVIMNSTLTIADNTIYFVESRNPAAKESATNLLLEPVQQDQHLVAIDLGTGKIRWEKPYDFSKCEFMTYMSHSGNTLVVLGTDRKKVYHTYAFDSRTGYPIWQDEKPAEKKHHSGHLAHPAIIGNRMYVNKHTYDLETGNVLAVDKFDWHGCGVMSASTHSIFHRFEYHGMLDLDADKRTEFLGIRSGCWLSMIPSGGVVLAPETSAGCSCSHAIQTSVAYVPKAGSARRSDPQKTD